MKYKQIVKFTSDNNKLIGNLYLPKNRENPPGVLILHGGGKATKERFLYLQEFLYQHSFVSFAFDFRGVGESEGSFESGSLENRLRDANAALHEFSKHVSQDKIGILGTSMGGHIAAQIAEREISPAVMLLYPAAYGKDAETKFLNDSFTQALRKENSWHNSPAFSALKKYTGCVLVLYGEQDTVIPQEVQMEYKELVKDKGEFILLQHATHAMLAPQNELQQKATDQAYAAIVSFLKVNFVL